jgi:hypothetical protein
LVASSHCVKEYLEEIRKEGRKEGCQEKGGYQGRKETRMEGREVRWKERPCETCEVTQRGLDKYIKGGGWKDGFINTFR